MLGRLQKKHTQHEQCGRGEKLLDLRGFIEVRDIGTPVDKT